MRLHETAAKQGSWLFRWRSFLPLFLVALLVPAMMEFRYLDNEHEYDLLWEGVCLLVGLLGLLVRCLTVGFAPRGTSGRNTREGQVATVLNTTGLYSLLRNPLYLGNYLMILGVLLMPAVNAFWLPLVYTLVFWVYYERIVMAEEAFLSEKFGEEYAAYAARTPAFLPRFDRWLKPALPFSLRSVLRREYPGFFGMIAAMFTVELVGDWIIEGDLHLDPIWFGVFCFALVVYVVLRTLKKHTYFLDVEGR